MSGNSLRDQLSGLMQARQRAREESTNKDKEKKAKTNSQNNPSEKAGEKLQHSSAAVKEKIKVKLTPMPGLPVSERAHEIIEAIKKNRVLILCGETGSGKTTQLPKLCALAGRGRKGRIAHTQPRRIAASSIAKRLAEETGTELGQWVGFKIRFTDKTEPQAKVKLMTDGILLAETQGDPLLKAYDTIIIDEAQNVPNIGRIVKMLVDANQKTKIFLTGSSALELAHGVRESAVGRIVNRNLWPLSLHELANEYGWGYVQTNLERFLVYGTYPATVTDPDSAVEQLIDLSGDLLFRGPLHVRGGVSRRRDCAPLQP